MKKPRPNEGFEGRAWAGTQGAAAPSGLDSVGYSGFSGKQNESEAILKQGNDTASLNGSYTSSSQVGSARDLMIENQGEEQTFSGDT